MLTYFSWIQGDQWKIKRSVFSLLLLYFSADLEIFYINHFLYPSGPQLKLLLNWIQLFDVDWPWKKGFYNEGWMLYAFYNIKCDFCKPCSFFNNYFREKVTWDLKSFIKYLQLEKIKLPCHNLWFGNLAFFLKSNFFGTHLFLAVNYKHKKCNNVHDHGLNFRRNKT